MKDYLLDSNTGEILHAPTNLRYIRRYILKWVNRYDYNVPTSVIIQRAPNGAGILTIRFAGNESVNPREYVSHWNSYAVLCTSLRYWRKLYGVPLTCAVDALNVFTMGIVEYRNAYLKDAVRRYRLA